MKKDIEEIRKEIDAVDKEIRDLFLKRMALAKEVAEYKINNNLAVEDSSREEEIVFKNSSELSDEMKKYYIELLRKMISISKDYQKEIMKLKW